MFAYRPLRRRIARQAARLLMSRHQDDLNHARAQAARQLHRGVLPRAALPSHGEIRDAMLRLAARSDAAIAPAGAEAPTGNALAAADPYRRMMGLLLPLEDVRLHPDRHPEGDALYHSLQVFELVRQQAPYDEELLAAALLHEIGKAIDPRAATAAAVAALEEIAEPRSVWLIGALPEGHALRSGAIGVRARRRLAAHPCCDDLRTLVDCDLQGRQVGMRVREVEEAVDYLRQLGRDWS